MTAAATTRQFWHRVEAVYRLYDAQGRLLYIGQTRYLPDRLNAHSREAWWWPLVRRTKVSVFSNRFTAHAAEQAAIRDEAPAYNVRVAGQPDRKSREHWTPKEYAMAERHRRDSYLRCGLDPDTGRVLPA